MQNRNLKQQLLQSRKSKLKYIIFNTIEFDILKFIYRTNQLVSVLIFRISKEILDT